MKNQRLQKILLFAVVLAALALLAIGSLKKHAILDHVQEAAAAPLKISDKQLIVDATFSGVQRKDGKLVSTYDRAAPKQGKQDCPT